MGSGSVGINNQVIILIPNNKAQLKKKQNPKIKM